MTDKGNILDAIRKAFTDVEDETARGVERKPPESVFMNRNRQDIFSFLCSRPCSALSNMTESMSASAPTVRWHLRRLADGGFVGSQKIGTRTVFYPADMISQDHIPILAGLNDPVRRRIFSAILSGRGMTQKELGVAAGLGRQGLSYNLRRLERSGLIAAMRDGRYVRYYPSDILHRLRQQSARQVGLFRKNLVKMLRKDGVSPRIARSTYGELHIEVSRGRERRMLVLHTDPFVTILAQ